MLASSDRSYEKLLSVSQIRAHQKITAICQPLHDLFQVDSFSYSNLNQQGNCLHIGSRPEILEDYLYSGQLLTSPSLSRYHYTLTPAIKIWDPENETKKELLPVCDYFQKNKLISGISHTVCKAETREIYYFGSHQTPKAGNDYWYDILPSLYEFISFFSTESKSILDKFKDHEVSLPTIIGESFYENKEGLDSLPKNHGFKKDDPRPLLQNQLLTLKGLTQREISIMQECFLGKTSKQIAQGLHISFRTVENNIQNIKEKLGLKSQKELMLYFSR